LFPQEARGDSMVDFEEQIAMALVIGYLKRAKPVSRESFWKAMNDLTDLAVHNIDGFAVEPFFWTMTPQGYPVSDQIAGIVSFYRAAGILSIQLETGSHYVTDIGQKLIETRQSLLFGGLAEPIISRLEQLIEDYDQRDRAAAS